MKTTKIIRSITVAGAVAATLSLSACDMNISFGPPDQDPEAAPAQTQEPESEVAANPEGDQRVDTETNDPGTGDSPDSSSSQGTSTNDGNGTSSSSASGSSSSDGGSSSSTREGAGASDPGFEIDEHGNGEIPASLLEKDIEKAYAKQGTTIDEVECLNDLMIISKKGSASCNVTAYGEKRYGTVKVTSVSGNYVGYSLDFPSFS